MTVTTPPLAALENTAYTPFALNVHFEIDSVRFAVVETNRVHLIAAAESFNIKPCSG